MWFTAWFHVQLTYAANLTPRDVAIFFSHTGATSDMVEAMKIAKNCGATLVSVTQFGKRPIVSMADYALYTSCPEVYRRSGAMSSRHRPAYAGGCALHRRGAHGLSPRKGAA